MLAQEAARAADAKKAEDVVVLDMGELLIVTDYFVICTASNKILMDAIGGEVEGSLQSLGVTPVGREGRGQGGGWLLVDFGGVVLHVFSPEAREYYRLDKLWSDAPVLDWQQAEAAGTGA
jgi:ribosome-associated protein